MRALVQRVSRAQVAAEGQPAGAIGCGLVVFLGVGKQDCEQQAQRLWGKIGKLRIFEDGQGKSNLSVKDVGAGVLVVSQFTLYADCKKGNRPSFTAAMEPERARELYEYFASLVKADMGSVATGVFGAHMEVSLVNDGPYTVWLDTDDLS